MESDIMEKKSGFLTFIAAMIPGIGYMYYGLVKKGVEALAIYLLLGPIFNTIGLNWIGRSILVVLWFYFFFDTFNVAAKINKGQFVPDSGFFFKDNSSVNENNFKDIANKMDKNKYTVLSIFLILIGVVSLLNHFIDTDIVNEVTGIIRNCFIPALFIAAGIYLLYKSRKSKEE